MSKTVLTLTSLMMMMNICYGYSGGAPVAVCEDMTPQHPDAPQTGDIPYTVTPNKKTVAPGDKVELKIAGKKPFKGFLLQVRDGDKSVGQFDIDSGHRYAKSIDCHGVKNSAATHKNSADKNDLAIEWIAPANKKTYTVFATVAENGGVYWVQKKMANIIVE